MIFRDVVWAVPGVFLRAGALLLLVGELYLCVAEIMERRKPAALAVFGGQLLLGFLLCYLLLEGTSYAFLEGLSRLPAVEWIYGLPVGWILLLETLLAAGLGVSLWRLWLARRNRPGAEDRKVAMDLLPVGLCFSDEEGNILLSNVQMNGFCREITGGRLTDAEEFWKQIRRRSVPEGETERVTTDQGRVLQLEKTRIQVSGQSFWQITGTDLTELYGANRALKEKNRQLKEFRDRLKRYQTLEEEMIHSQEVLKARSTVHDEVGQLLLTQKYYLDHPESVEEETLLQTLKRSNEFLLREGDPDRDPQEEELGEVIRMGRSIGVEIEIRGDLPEGEKARGLLRQALVECAANTVKHGEGDRLLVELTRREGRQLYTFTNNGKPPVAPVREVGGLLSLRRKVEEMGGTMTIESRPAFRLIIEC